MFIRKSVFKRSIALATVSGVIIGVLVAISLQPTQSKTFLWTQNDWSLGVTSSTTDGDPQPPTNWREYSSADVEIVADASGLQKASVQNDTTIFWDDDVIPTGWEDITVSEPDFEGKLLRIATSVTTPLTSNSNTTHTHQLSFGSDSGQWAIGYPATGSVSSKSHSHTKTSNTGSSYPEYRKLKLIKRVGGPTRNLPQGAIAFFENKDSLIGDWDEYSAQGERFIYVSASSPTVNGGSNTHNHTLSGSTSGGSGSKSASFSGGMVSPSHTHTISGTSGLGSSIPEYSAYPLGKLTGGDAPIPTGMISVFVTEPVAPWAKITTETGRYLRPDTTNSSWPVQSEDDINHTHTGVKTGGAQGFAPYGSPSLYNSPKSYARGLAHSTSLKTELIQPPFVDVIVAAFRPDAVAEYKSLTSSQFNSTDPANIVAGILWEESSSDALGSRARFQLRTSSSCGIPASPCSWSDWIGPDGTNSSHFEYPNITGCSKSGTSVTCDFLQMSNTSAMRDALDDEWVQYKVEMIEGVEIDEITLKYVRNTAPDVEVDPGFNQNADGLVSGTFRMMDEESDDKVKPYLFYDAGFTLDTTISAGAGVVIVTDLEGNMSSIPSSGKLLIDDEIIDYDEKSIATLEFRTLTRGDGNTEAISHSAGDKTVWIQAAQAAFAGATLSCANQNNELTDCYSPPTSLTQKSVTWDAAAEISGIYKTDLSLRIVLNDGAIARHTSIEDGSITNTFEFDVKTPELRFEGLAPITLMDQDHELPNCEIPNDNSYTCLKTNKNLINVLASAQDDTSLQQNLSTNGSFSDANWTSYSQNFTLTLPGSCNDPTGCPETVWVKFRDSKGNETGIESDSIVLDTIAPAAPANPIIQDVSNPNEGDFKLYVSWGALTGPSDFHHYAVYRSEDGITNFGTDPIKEVPDENNPGDIVGDFSQNFYVDNNREQGERYYYKMTAVDDIDNESTTFSQVIDLVPDQGPQSGGEGETNATTPVTISGVDDINESTSGATITLDTDRLATIQIRYSLNPGEIDSDSSQGSLTPKTTGHAINLVGLVPGETYYYRPVATAIDDDGETNGPSGQFDTLEDTDTPPTITSTPQHEAESTSATVTWATNEATSGIVEFGKSSSFGSVAGSLIVSGTTHNVELTGLDPDTTYHYRVRSRNASDLEVMNPTSGSRTLRTDPDTSDQTPPVITGVNVSPGKNNATISWQTTDDPSSSFVEWGDDTNYGHIFGDPSMDTSHSVTLPSVLNADQLYYFKLRSVDQAGLEAHPPYESTFTTLPDSSNQTPPYVTSHDPATDVEVTPTSATINWTTSEATDASVGFSVQGVTPLYSNIQGNAMASPPVSNHTVQVVGLDPGTTYVYQLRFTDVGGTGVSKEDGTYLFTTEGVITDSIDIEDLTVVVDEQSITHNSATITWDTDIIGDSFVEYGFYEEGEIPDYEFTQGQFQPEVEEHSVTLTELLADTTYTIRVRSRGPDGNSDVYPISSGNQITFSTTAAPDVTPPKIVDTEISQVGTTGVSITWETDEDSIGKINYGTTDAYGESTALGTVYKTSGHAATIPGLKAGTTYHYQIYAEDQAGNAATSSVDATFVTKPEDATDAPKDSISLSSLDFDPPGLSEIKVSDITKSTAIISWATNEDSDSVVPYGTTTEAVADYPFTEASLTLGITHVVALKGLNASTTYYFKVTSQDAAGNRGRSPEFNFTTAPGVNDPEGEEGELTDEEELEKRLEELLGLAESVEGAPTITEVKVTSITSDSAIVNWQTNERSDSMARYGFTSEYTETTEPNPDLVFDHWVPLSGLEPGSLYHIQVQSTDAEGQTGVSQDVIFRTLVLGAENVPPIVTGGPEITDLTSTAATIKWITDKPGTSIVRYKPARSFLLNLVTRPVQIGEFERFTLAHEIHIPNLKPDTAYRFQVISQSPNGTIMRSPEEVFRTKALSEIYDVRIEAITYNSAQINWKTGTRATTEFQYGRSSTYDENIRKLTFSLQHSVNLTNLSPDTLYHFRLRGTDERGQSVITNDFTFKTFGVPVIEEKRVELQDEDNVKISWKTDKDTDTFVLITDENGNQQTFGSPKLGTSHEVDVTGLEGDKEYTYQIIAKDKFGQEASSQQFNFRTGKDVEPPVIDQVRTETSLKPDGTGIQAVVSWLTNEPATSQVIYRQGLTDLDDETVAPTITPLDDSLKFSHIVLLPDFKPGEVYRFKVRSMDKNGNQSESKDFTVLAPRQSGSIVDIIIENLEETFGFLRQLQ